MLIDGLQCGHFTREVFQELRRGEVSCLMVSCGFGRELSTNSVQ
jgi:membrane dipeptidase